MRLVLLIDGSEPEVVVQAFRAGARGVFARSESHFERLCKCILRVHEGQIWAKTQQLEFIVNALAQAPSLRVVDANGANLLTKREEDLVHLVADGLGNRDIARRLNLAENTVKNYLFHVFDKLGISNRVELVLYALSNSKRAEMSTSSDNAPQLVAAHSHVSAPSPGKKVS
jgi:DNA-binding NarL/FixJ family response regulator